VGGPAHAAAPKRHSAHDAISISHVTTRSAKILVPRIYQKRAYLSVRASVMMSITYTAMWRYAADIYARTIELMIADHHSDTRNMYKSVAMYDKRRVFEERRSAYVAKLWADDGVDYV